MGGDDRPRTVSETRRTAFRTAVRPSESTTEAVLRALAAMEGVDETELDVLYERTEPEALEDLVGHARGTDRYVGVEFTYREYTVLVRGDGVIDVTDDAPRTASNHA